MRRGRKVRRVILVLPARKAQQARPVSVASLYRWMLSMASPDLPVLLEIRELLVRRDRLALRVYLSSEWMALMVSPDLLDLRVLLDRLAQTG